MALVTVIIPTHNRPHLLDRAIASALAQDVPGDLEVLVVDDGSTPPAIGPEDARVRILRLDPCQGGAAARNAGLDAASGTWITFLDDDDELLPGMIASCLEAIETSDLPAPIAAVTALEQTDQTGKIVEYRYPPTLPRGSAWNLESVPRDRSFNVKQSLVIARDVLAGIGGFDKAFPSRVHSELFLRLNAVCSIAGVDRVGYRRHLHGGPMVTGNRNLRKASFRMFTEKHDATLRRYPSAFTALMLAHARSCRRARMYREALRWLVQACRYDTLSAIRHVAVKTFVRR